MIQKKQQLNPSELSLNLHQGSSWMPLWLPGSEFPLKTHLQWIRHSDRFAASLQQKNWWNVCVNCWIMVSEGSLWPLYHPSIKLAANPAANIIHFSGKEALQGKSELNTQTKYFKSWWGSETEMSTFRMTGCFKIYFFF